VFVRSLVGLDRRAAKEAMAEFIFGKAMSANQIEFINLIINLIINHLTQHGPLTDLASQGPEELFSSGQIDELIALIDRVRARAMAA
jgi:type I restriction enzyme R subunit